MQVPTQMMNPADMGQAPPNVQMQQTQVGNSVFPQINPGCSHDVSLLIKFKASTNGKCRTIQNQENNSATWYPTKNIWPTAWYATERTKTGRKARTAKSEFLKKLNRISNFEREIFKYQQAIYMISVSMFYFFHSRDVLAQYFI